MSKITKKLSQLKAEVGMFGTIFCIKGRQDPSLIQVGRILVVAKRTQEQHQVEVDFYKICGVQKLKFDDLKITLQSKVIISDRNIQNAKIKALMDISSKFEQYFGVENKFTLKSDSNKFVDLSYLLMPVETYQNSDDHLIVFDGNQYLPVQCYNDLARVGNPKFDLVETKPGMFFIRISKNVVFDPKYLKIELITQVNANTNTYHSKQVAFHSFSENQLSKMINCFKNQFKFFSIKSYTIQSNYDSQAA